MALAYRSLGMVMRAMILAFFAIVVAGCSTKGLLDIDAPLPPSSAKDSNKYAVLVLDGNSGRVMHAVNADAARHPASLTKMMTLYMLFEALQTGQVGEMTEIPVSRNAAAQPPTNLKMRAGETITVRTAIQALAVKSANDVAVAVGEYLGGTEQQFAARMTAKARELGLKNTVFRNASGLPDAAQVTTARDMALLGMQLRRRFPQYFWHFSASDFNFRGRSVDGHNDMMGRVTGVNGIKTGYIRSSGFNIVTTVEHGGKHLVVVVMGGGTARARNEEVEALIRRFLPRAVTQTVKAN